MFVIISCCIFFCFFLLNLKQNEFLVLIYDIYKQKQKLPIFELDIITMVYFQIEQFFFIIFPGVRNFFKALTCGK